VPPIPALTRLAAPRYWGYHAVVVAALVAAGWLGLWQLHGWQERRAAEARDLTEVAPIPLDDAIGPDDPFPARYVGQPVDAEGTWVAGATVYVSGREHDGTDGYWVVDFLQVGPVVLPTVRGWTAEPDAVAPPAGPVAVTGWLQPPEGTGAVDDDPADDIVPQLRIADLAQRFDEDLYGAYLVQRDPPSDVVRADLEELPEAGSLTALRNLLYAVEWWFFGLFALFVWWRWAREESESALAGR
jgi:surfeit locus 1 family protein